LPGSVPKPHVPAADASVREASPPDTVRIVDIINAAYKPRDGRIFAGPRTDVDEITGAMTAPSRMLVAEIEGEVVACVRLVIGAGETWFGLLATSVDHQGRGLAPMLIADCERRAREAGAQTIGIGVIREVGLRPYYESLGYTVVRETPGSELPWATQPTLQPFVLIDMEKQL
jgi:predicted N-acetyltransferase YhbS